MFKYRKSLGNCSEDAGKFVLDAPCAEEPWRAFSLLALSCFETKSTKYNLSQKNETRNSWHGTREWNTLLAYFTLIGLCFSSLRRKSPNCISSHTVLSGLWRWGSKHQWCAAMLFLTANIAQDVSTTCSHTQQYLTNFTNSTITASWGHKCNSGQQNMLWCSPWHWHQQSTGAWGWCMPPVARSVELETFQECERSNLSMEGGNVQSRPSQLCLEVLDWIEWRFSFAKSGIIV